LKGLALSHSVGLGDDDLIVASANSNTCERKYPYQ
jgi:hypothetical protein